jgi:hypothetical protein
MEHAFFLPVLPGKTEAAKAFAKALMNERRADLDSALTTITKESWFIQSTPMGDFMIVYFQAPDPDAVHAALAASQDPFDVWFRAQVLDVTGVDVSKPPESSPVQIFDWTKK